VADGDPDYYAIIPRAAVEELAKGEGKLAIWTREMLANTDEEAVFLRGARTYFQNADRNHRRKALAFLATMFGASRSELKRYLRFKSVVNLMD
jgi:hypothetical protein